jgi:hypothetical protein
MYQVAADANVSQLNLLHDTIKFFKFAKFTGRFMSHSQRWISSLTEFEQVHMNNFTNLFKFHISREKIHIGRKPEFESEPQR